MAVLSDKTIKRLARDEGMIQPLTETSVKHNALGERIASYGVSSYGYDLRAAGEFKIFAPPRLPTLWERIKAVFTGKPIKQTVIDWKKITEDMFESYTGDQIIVPPGGFLLTRSVEYVKVPRNVVALCIGKSTVARAGWNCLCTPIEPEWEGYITFEFQNTTAHPNVFHANEGVLQLVFLTGDEDCETSYADRGGKYNHQPAEIVLPRV